ncbi:hypothetical protein BB561_005269 [Smittium simulii]|uniref:PX domain-containing protein n=1 Tax=Smittium simulii TaxID=133385 RepID=A0A2T9YB86_9FUNG|nr:hypothetical protein BB561_005269 [Smittium simulii]
MSENCLCCTIANQLNLYYGPAQALPLPSPHSQNSIKIIKSELQLALRKRYISYLISFDDQQVFRRYSEFDGLRYLLTRIYPTIVVPPLPDKHSLFQHIYTNNKTKTEKKIVQNRVRGLEIFLNRIALNKTLRQEHIFHRFLKSDDSWDEILHSTTVTNLPSNPLYFSPSHNLCHSPDLKKPLERTSIAATNDIVKVAPIPSFFSKITQPNIEWENHVIESNVFYKIWKEKIELNSKKIALKLKLLNDSYSELGAILNAFSLITESNTSSLIEHTGQTIDKMVSNRESTQNTFSIHVWDPIFEYSKFFSAKKNVLHFRDLKQIQIEQTQAALKKANTKINHLTYIDNEFNRLSTALASDTIDSDLSSKIVESPTQNQTLDTTQFNTNSTSIFQKPSLDNLSKNNSPEINQNNHLSPPEFFNQKSLIQNTDFSEFPSISNNYKNSSSDINCDADNRKKNKSYSTKKTLIEKSHDEQQPSEKSLFHNDVLKNEDNYTSQPDDSVQVDVANLPLQSRIIESPKVITSSLLNQLSFALYKIVDIDPGQQRKLKIAKLKKKISVLKELDLILSKDIDIISENILESINGFHSTMKVDLYFIFTHIATLEIAWSKKDCDFWMLNSSLFENKN